LRAVRKTQIAGTSIDENELIAARWPNRSALAEAVVAAKASKAYGRHLLPSARHDAGWRLVVTTAGAVSVQAKRRVSCCDVPPRGTLQLTNASAIDLEPRLTGESERDRGYALEVDAPAPIWREAMEGDFWRVTAHADPEGKPQPVAVPPRDALDVLVQPHASWRPTQNRADPDRTRCRSKRDALPNSEPPGWRKLALDRMNARRLTIVLLAATAASPQLCRASGPWFDEAPPTLPFYLHRLPAKTCHAARGGE
jgi:hypothetical protein